MRIINANYKRIIIGIFYESFEFKDVHHYLISIHENVFKHYLKLNIFSFIYFN